jgi:hypothetical protein
VAIPRKVTRFSTIETGSFGSGATVFLLWLGGCRIVIGIVVLLRVRSVSVGIVALVLLVVMGHSATR